MAELEEVKKASQKEPEGALAQMKTTIQEVYDKVTPPTLDISSWDTHLWRARRGECEGG